MRIYTFYKNTGEDNPIIVTAATYLEAVNAVKELNNYAALEYNFNEYKQENIDPMPYLNIDKDYWCLPYIMSQKQYDDIKKNINKNIPKPFRKEIDNSVGDENYNAATLTKNSTVTDRYYKINEKNGRTKENIDDIDNKTDYSLLFNIKKDIKQIISNYVYSINNKDTRNSIYNDLIDLVNKYDKELDTYSNKILSPKDNKNQNNVKFAVDDALSMLKNKIKGED